MSEPNALVTGASGFVGRQLVATLLRRGIPVRATIHNAASERHFKGLGGFETAVVDILDRRSLLGALDGITEVYHLAALVDARARHNELYRINVEGTRNVWECSAEAGVRKALYCSSASVYGLLAGSARQITEDVQPRAVEPYGRSKLMGEAVALEIGNLTGPATVVIRPAAVFGPGNLTDFGRSLRNASVSRLISAGTVRSWKFSFVHVQDVAEAAVHLMHAPGTEAQVYNVVVDRPVPFDEAFQAYQWALDRCGRLMWREKLIAGMSAAASRIPGISQTLNLAERTRLVFPVWRPGFDLTYSSRKLLDTSFRFKWERFGDVLLSCLG